ncbi:hypothetical protein LWI29_011317 [Acer saccharum]|uniref:Uncharacterized protein n=1 Tax=Acer saccharum TaxID=4024 RepID=A0AA39VBM2_ACESA|nr:hypothetical protein LWI29_011317 [Acer saccharum]
MSYVKPLRLYKKSLKWKSSKPGRLLCLDVNEKYVDLAVTDPENIVAVPLSCLHRQENNLDLIADKLQTLVSL